MFHAVPDTGEISTHAPHTGSDRRTGRLASADCRISTHAPHTGSDGGGDPPTPRQRLISTHAPHTGSDYGSLGRDTGRNNFNSRSPYGERSGVPRVPSRPHGISTHAPHTGSDKNTVDDEDTKYLFQLTLPIRGAIRSIVACGGWVRFQLTLPIRGAISR